jgi:hypothetical protein
VVADRGAPAAVILGCGGRNRCGASAAVVLGGGGGRSSSEAVAGGRPGRRWMRSPWEAVAAVVLGAAGSLTLVSGSFVLFFGSSRRGGFARLRDACELAVHSVSGSSRRGGFARLRDACELTVRSVSGSSLLGFPRGYVERESGVVGRERRSLSAVGGSARRELALPARGTGGRWRWGKREEKEVEVGEMRRGRGGGWGSGGPVGRVYSVLRDGLNQARL